LKKLLVGSLVFAMIAALAAASALAAPQADAAVTQETESETQEDETNISCFSEEELADILTPDSPLYFLKRLWEKVVLTLTFKEDKKVEYMAKLATERAKEYQALENKFSAEEINDEQLAHLDEALEDTLQFTEQYMNCILEDDAEDEPLEEFDGDRYEQRIAHLQRIAERAPEAAQKGLARAIANARRQRERMLAKGKLADYIQLEELPNLPFHLFKLEAEAKDYELKVEYKLVENQLLVKVKIEPQDGAETVLKGQEALEYLQPILEGLDLNTSMSDHEVIAAVLAVFSLDRPWDEVEIKIVFSDGTKIELESEQDDEDEEDPLPIPPGLPFSSFEVDIEAGARELEVEFEQEDGKLKAKVKIEKDDGDRELEGAKALEYLIPILEKLNLSASMSKQQIANALTAAFGWDSYEKIKVKILFSEGTKIEFELAEEKSPPNPSIDLPYVTFQLEVESDDCELEVKFKQRGGKFEAEVEMEKENGRDTELKGTKALDYLLPILKKLNLNASMSRDKIISAVQTAFGLRDVQEFELKIEFTNGTKIKIETD